MGDECENKDSSLSITLSVIIALGLFVSYLPQVRKFSIFKPLIFVIL